MAAPCYVLTLEPLPRDTPPDIRVRMLLKHALRGLGLRCTYARMETPMQVIYVLEGEHERGPEAWPWQLPPTPGLHVCFGANPDVVAQIASVWLIEGRPAIEVHLERLLQTPMSAAEAALWRASGFAVEVPPPMVSPWHEAK